MTIHTDGGCSTSTNNGSWAFALSKKEFKSGKAKNTTSNRMELRAIIEAIIYVKSTYPDQRPIMIMTDSKYCTNGFNNWMYKWQEKGWNNDKKNLDLWRILYALRHNVRLKWVKGHNGDIMNEFVDSLCVN